MSEGSNKLEAARELGVCIVTDGTKLDGVLKVPMPCICCTCKREIHPTTTMLTFMSSNVLSNKEKFEQQLQTYFDNWKNGFSTWGYIVDEKLWLCSSCFDKHMIAIAEILGRQQDTRKDNELFFKHIPLFERLVTDVVK